MKATCCIFCNDPAGSAEHTILAALGGLRTHRGILCERCNNDFGATVDAALVREMNPINAIVGVMNGRTREPIATVVEETATGRSFVLTNGRTLAHPEATVVADTTQDGVRSILAVASTQKQADDFVRQLKNEDKPVKVQREVVPHLFVTTPTVLWNFGDPEAHRGLVRLVLNIVATFRPEVARDNGLAECKEFIRNGGPHEPWVNYAYLEQVAEVARFDFSHRFTVMFDADRQEVRAQVSLLDIIELSVRLGSARLIKTETITYEMNVLAKSAPSDIAVSMTDGLVYPNPVPPTMDPLPLVQDRVAQALFKRNARLWADDAPALFSALNATREREPNDRHEAIVEILCGQRQRLLNIASFFARDIRPRLIAEIGDEAGTSIADALALLVQPEPANRTGVTEVTRVHAEMLAYVMADRLFEILNERPIEADELRFLLEGRPGAAVIGNYMLEQVFGALPAPRSSA